MIFLEKGLGPFAATYIGDRPARVPVSSHDLSRLSREAGHSVRSPDPQNMRRFAILPERDIVDRGHPGCAECRMRDVENDQDGDASEPERRRCYTRDGDRAHHAVDPAVLLQRRDGAERDCDEEATTVAITAISSEIGKRAAISSVTGLSDHIEIPKSRRKKPHTKSRNCRISGRSSPSSAWKKQSATACGSTTPATGAE